MECESPLKVRHGKTLEKKCCFPGVFCDNGDTTANLLRHLNPKRPLSGCSGSTSSSSSSSSSNSSSLVYN